MSVDTEAFSGQIAVITGASSGIGRAIAVALASAGADVALVGRDIEALRLTAAACPKSRRATLYPLDFTDEHSVTQLSKSVRRDFGGTDLLVHSAGVITPGSVETAPVEELDRHYRVNVRVPYELTRNLLPDIKRQKGQIVFINSSVGLAGKADFSQYAATKHALKGFADSLRQEVNASDVRVLSVFVGRCATPMQAALYQRDSRKYLPNELLQPSDVAKAVLQSLSLPRTAETTDLQVRPMTKPRNSNS